MPKLAQDNPALDRVLYAGPMMEFFTRFLGGPVLHYDFTRLRAVSPGLGTQPHCDIVYMGRGTRRLFTAWTPLGDIGFDQGGLMILEDSPRQADRLRKYLNSDVDSYCTNGPFAAAIESGQRGWTKFTGGLSKDPVSLRAKLGGRWLTTEYAAGDVLIFSVTTVHASLDNPSNRIRLSSDSRYQLASEPADERWIGANPIGHGHAGKRGRIC
jgi:ectoine hydroxylase-related dioxygenase (phytanoyl-CoA dioxygenase family)